MATTTGNNPDEIQLTHAEIWDDSTLVEAWDEALAEYKKYHSIAATGEDKEALIKSMEKGKPEAQVEREMTDAPVAAAAAAPETDTAATITTEDQKPTVAQDDSSVQTKEVSEPSEERKAPEEPISEEPTATASSDQQAPSPASFPFAQMHPAGPAAGYAIGGNDEVMRNLMMAWYWAGYYTGLREGQQQKAIEQQQQQQ